MFRYLVEMLGMHCDRYTFEAESYSEPSTGSEELMFRDGELLHTGHEHGRDFEYSSTEKDGIDEHSSYESA